MSLNKLTNSSDYLEKQYLNIGCNDIKCSTLQVAGSPTVPADDGRFTPVITVNDGSTINTQVGLYNVIGVSTQAVIDFSIKAKLVVATSAFAYLLTINLPDGWTCFDTINAVSVGNMFTKGATADSYIVEDALCVTGQSTVTVKFNLDGAGTPIPVGVGENILNFTLKLLVKK